VSGGLTPGDPLGGEGPRREQEPPPAGSPAAPEAPAAPPATGAGGYGAGRVPPGAFAPRARDHVAEPVSPDRLASWGQRAVAAIIDSLLVAAVAGVVLAIVGALLFGAASLDTPGGVVGVLVVALIVIPAVAVAALAYAPLVMARTNGKTVGKMVTGCRVVRADGRRVDFLWAAYREVLIKTLLLGVAGSLTAGIGYLVDYLWPLFDDRNRALHDIVVDSLVVRD
jgi:uncharacterized RDD family membrane protein YckC